MAALALAAAGAPAAAAAWEPAERISAWQTFVASPVLVEQPSGRAVAAWNRQQGSGGGALAGVELAARNSESWGRAHSLGFGRRPHSVTLVDLAGYGRSRALALTTRAAGRGEALTAAFVSASGRARARQLIARAQFFSSADLAATAAGDAVVAWTTRFAGPARAEVAYRRAGAPFMRVGAISAAGADSTAAGSNGRVAAVAWERRGLIEARMSRDGGHSWGETLIVARLPANRATISVDVSKRGAVAIAWMAQARSEGGDFGAAVLGARLRPVGRGFGAVTRLERYQELAPEGGRQIEVAFAGERAVVAWQGLDRAATSEPSIRRFAVRSAELSATGLRDAVTVSDPARPARFEDLAARAGVAASWRSGSVEGELAAVEVAVRGPGGAAGWEDAEPVSPPGQLAGESQLAWDADGGLSAVWRGAQAGRGEAVFAARREPFFAAGRR